MIKKLFSFLDSNEKQVKGTDKELKKIKEAAEIVRNKSFEEMRERVKEMKNDVKVLVDRIPLEFRKSVKKVDRRKGLSTEEQNVQKKLMEFLPEMYAMINEVHRRKIGWEYYDVQLRAGIVLAQGQRLVEQYTGEGKTQTFMLPLGLYALAGRGSHLVTVNDYLTRIGAEYAGHTFNELGLTVGVITPNTSYKFISDEDIKTFKGDEATDQRKSQLMKIDSMTGVNLLEAKKREAYGCDITYGTNNEFGFDYLRDNMAWGIERVVQRELYFCIIDEADSILIDEARTPLIISATPSDSDTEKYLKFAEAVRDLEENVDYEIDHKQRAVTKMLFLLA